MKMIFNTLLAATAVMTTLVSCADNSDKGKGDSKDTKPGQSLWILGSNDLISKVEVSSGSTAMETYDFTYDQYSRLATLVKKDMMSQSKLLDLKYTYADVDEMDIEGNYYMMSTAAKTVAKIDKDANSVTYVGDWTGAWTYCTSFDDNNTVAATEAGEEYASTGNYYSLNVQYAESYKVSNGDVASVTLGTETSGKSTVASSAASETNTVISYTYSSNVDYCNFNVFLMNCEFPVWFAKELPGCKHLIKGMTMKTGDVTSPLSFTVDYKYDSTGKMIEATRKDYDGKTLVLERTYKITYL